MNSESIEGPTSPAYSFIESRRTKLVDPMTVSELEAVCSVLEFDRWLFDEDKSGRHVVRRIFLTLEQLPDGAFWVGDLVVCDSAYEALIRITDIDGTGSLLTARGQTKTYKTIETAISDMQKILKASAGESDSCTVSLFFNV